MYKHEIKTGTRRARARTPRKKVSFPFIPTIASSLLAALAAGVLIGARFTRSVGSTASAGLPLVPEASATEKAKPNLLFVPFGTSSPDPSEAAPVLTTEAPKDGGDILLASDELTVSVDGIPVSMKLEDYLVGVVAGEMYVSSELEALRAQAVAARTFTVLHMLGKARCKSGCTVCDDSHCCQAYRSESELRAAWGSRYDTYITKIRSAVRSTEGLIVTFDGAPISALYHASSGAATENCEEVFSVALPYLVSVDSREGDAEMISVQEFSIAEVVGKLNELWPEAHMKIPLGKDDFSVWGRTESGRVQLIQIGEVAITGADLRRALGLRSTAFTVDIDGKKMTFTCQGYGHGVGMSQTGANEMAKDGADFEEILAHFYTGTALARIRYGS